jgi:predicted RNA binding protein YcfA (HicA-like mRNA interferase family)
MAEYEKKVRDMLYKHGYLFDRHGKGSHDIWRRDKKTVSVAYRIPSRHTANDILKQAGIDFKF